jgi:16S rRNA processing protein RimM
MPVVGKILKAHGVGGAVKAEIYMDSADSFAQFSDVVIDNAVYGVERVSQSGGFAVLKLRGVDNPEDAEKLRSKLISVERAALPQTEEGRFYLCDIIGCTVTDGSKTYGKIKDVLQNGGADVIVAEYKGATVMFPWITDLKARVDVDAKLFSVDAKIFSEVAVYGN